MVVASTLHLFHEYAVPCVSLNGIDEAVGQEASEILALVDCADEHVDFLVLAEEMLAAKEIRWNHPHPH